LSFIEPLQVKNKTPFTHAGKVMENKIYFAEETTDSFFKRTNPIKQTNFDVIFIDADHSYEGARKDYDNALKHINDGGLIIFHDINSAACPGIQRLWKEAKADHKSSWEFVHSNTCGIGVIQVK
jgi:predicted O-methyltransferase YrrM